MSEFVQSVRRPFSLLGSKHCCLESLQLPRTCEVRRLRIPQQRGELQHSVVRWCENWFYQLSTQPNLVSKAEGVPNGNIYIRCKRQCPTTNQFSGLSKFGISKSQTRKVAPLRVIVNWLDRQIASHTWYYD